MWKQGGSPEVSADGQPLATGGGRPLPPEWVAVGLALGGACWLMALRWNAESGPVGWSPLPALSLGALFGAAAVIGAIAAWSRRRPLLLAAGLATGGLSVLAFSGVTLVLLVPAVLFLYSIDSNLAPPARRPVLWFRALAAAILTLLIAFIGLFTLGIVSLLLVAIGLPLAVGLVHGMRVVLVGKDGSAIAQLTRGAIDVALAGAITLMVGLAAVALFSNTETVCWRQHETAQGRWIEQMPASAESPVVTGSSGGATVFSFESGPVGGDVTAAGCDSGVVTPNGTLLEAGFLSGALALAMVVGGRSRPN